MSNVERLLTQLKNRGLSIRPGSVSGELLLAGPAAEKSPIVLRAVKAFKPQLIVLFGQKKEEDQDGYTFDF